MQLPSGIIDLDKQMPRGLPLAHDFLV
jgi:hypothetical protein